MTGIGIQPTRRRRRLNMGNLVGLKPSPYGVTDPMEYRTVFRRHDMLVERTHDDEYIVPPRLQKPHQALKRCPLERPPRFHPIELCRSHSGRRPWLVTWTGRTAIGIQGGFRRYAQRDLGKRVP